MVEYSHEDLRQALDAIIHANATDEAYEVAARSGYYELFPGVIFRKEHWMEISVAREVVKRAKADEIFDGPVPENDAECIAKANEIFEMAEQAWQNNVRGPEVEAIRNIVNNGVNGGAPESESEDNSDEHAPPETEGEVSLTGGTIPDIDPKYDKSEPWEGYNELTVADISGGVEWFKDDDDTSAEELQEILKNVYGFEKAHKNRSRILNYAIEQFVEAGGTLAPVEEEDESDSTPDSSESVDAESVSEEEGEADSGESHSDAGADSEPEASAPSGEGSSGEKKSTGQDKSGGSSGGSGGQSREAKLVEIVEKELRRERVDGIPAPPKDKAPELPWNWADVSDQTLHDLHMQYASLAYYKAYRRTRDDRIAQLARDAADEIRNKLLVDAPKYDEKNKEVKVTVLEAQISSDPNVRAWRKLQHKYERFASASRLEVDSLHKVVEALSRLETMRHDAWERSRK